MEKYVQQLGQFGEAFEQHEAVDHGVQVLDVLFRSAEGVDVDVVRVLVLNYAQKSIPKDYVVDVLPGVVHCGRDHGIHVFVLVLHQLDQVFEQI